MLSLTSKVWPQPDVVSFQQFVHRVLDERHVARFVDAGRHGVTHTHAVNAAAPQQHSPAFPPSRLGPSLVGWFTSARRTSAAAAPRAAARGAPRPRDSACPRGPLGCSPSRDTHAGNRTTAVPSTWGGRARANSRSRPAIPAHPRALSSSTRTTLRPPTVSHNYLLCSFPASWLDASSSYTEGGRGFPACL